MGPCLNPARAGCFQIAGCEGLNVVADSKTEPEMVGDAYGVLCERRVFIAVRMTHGWPQALNVVVRDLVRISTQSIPGRRSGA